MKTRTAKSFFKRYLRYHFARYGAYQAMGMPEFGNEGDKDSVYNSNAVFQSWHQEMDAYWKSLDIYNRPTTTSFAWRDHNGGAGYSTRYLRLSYPSNNSGISEIVVYAGQ